MENWIPRLKQGCSIKSFVFLILFVAAASFESLAQNTEFSNSQVKSPDTKRIYLKLTPIPILFGPIPTTSEYGLGFEVVVSNRFSYQVNGSLLSKTILYQTNLVPDSLRSIIDAYEFPGYRLQGQVRYYFLKSRSGKSLNDYMSPTGMYIALHGSYAAATFKDKNFGYPREDWKNITVDGYLGMQLIYKENLGIDCFMGLGYKQNSAIFTNYRMVKSDINIGDIYTGGLGAYLTSPIKITAGFSLTFGVI